MILEMLKKRASIRSFSCKAVSEEKIDRILEAGRLAPSGGNEQSWKFGLITDRDLIAEVAKISYSQNWIKDASFLVVLCTGMVGQERGGRNVLKARFPSLREQIEQMDEKLYAAVHMEEHQTKIPGTQMMLAALEEGVYSTWISYFQVAVLNERIGIPAGWTASEILAFGYPKKEQKMKAKKSKEEIVFHNQYGEKK